MLRGPENVPVRVDSRTFASLARDAFRASPLEASGLAGSLGLSVPGGPLPGPLAGAPRVVLSAPDSSETPSVVALPPGVSRGFASSANESDLRLQLRIADQFTFPYGLTWHLVLAGGSLTDRPGDGARTVEQMRLCALPVDTLIQRCRIVLQGALDAALALKADTADMTTALAGKGSVSAVNWLLANGLTSVNGYTRT